MCSGLHNEDVECNPVIAGSPLSMPWSDASTSLLEGHTGLLQAMALRAAKDTMYLWLPTACLKQASYFHLGFVLTWLKALVKSSTERDTKPLYASVFIPDCDEVA